MTKRTARALALVVAAVLAATVSLAKADAADPRVQTLTHARFALSGAVDPVHAEAAATAITLPDDWARSRPHATGPGWYYLNWTPPENRARICAVYLTATTVPVEVYVNGRLIGATGSLLGPRPRSWQQSQLFVIPSDVMRTGRNVIALRVNELIPGTAGMGPVLAGPEPALRERAMRDLLLHTLGPAVVSAAIVVLGVFILVLWLRRRDPIYGLFGLAAVLWGAHTGLSLLAEPLLPQPHWSIAWNSTYLLFVGLLCLFCVRFAHVDWPRYRGFVVAYVALVPLVLYASNAFDELSRARMLVRLGGIGIVFVALYAVARYALRRRDTEGWLLLGAGAVSAVFAVHDWLVAQNPDEIRPLMLVPYAGLAFLLLVGWILTDRFVRALNEFETLNASLEQRVIEKSDALNAQLAQTRAARDRAEAADRAKSRFLAAASHDLRQPLHALGLFAARLGGQTRDADDAALVQRIQTSVASLDSLFSALLDISKLEAGAITAQPRAIALDPLFARIANDFAPEALERQLELSVLPTRYAVTSDPVLLERIVRNLVANAIRYTRAGGIVVGARRRGGRISIEVWDSGPGIAPNELARVFEEFYQVGNPERDRARGLGLGLAIVRRLSLLLDHEVTVSSRVGRGSVFRVVATAADPAQAEVPAAPTAVTLDPLAGKRIVLVDDEEPVREAMRQTLVAWGATPVVGGDVDEALLQWNGAPPPDALIVDYRLRGGCDGIEATARLRAAFGGDVPTIVVSGESSTEHLARIKASGLVLLHKPVAPARLRAALTYAIARTATTSA